MQAFTLDHTSAIPVKLQLKAQVKYQLLAGLVRPGDQLPPLRDMAAGLGIHLNTVVRAVAELEEEGFVYSHQGKGVFVADEFPGQGQGAALRSLLAGVLQSAREFGMSPEEMALATLASGQLARPPQAAPNRMLLVGGSRQDLRRLQSQLEASLPTLVVPLLAEELAERPRSLDFTVAACTLFHEADVRRHLPAATLAVLADDGAREALAAIRELEAGAPVAIAARDWLHAARIRRSLEGSGFGHLRLEMCLGQAPAHARGIVEAADCRAAGPPDVLRAAESAVLPSEALAALRKGLGTPTAKSSVHIRSVWV
ncbi:MAG TPA: GntR family transcriptional regulator [Symbiobacteriaceae bacterium]|nr:GntR family transcriptional regulator [Symbiobacteriaceae bacterium]